jgi:signal transduction histidine kinase
MVLGSFRPGALALRWPIRNQIFVPFVAVVLLAIVAMTTLAAVQAARQREVQTLSQLRNVVETLAHTSVPYTEAVLHKMRGLSGAEFVACDARGGVVASTLPVGTSPPAGFGAASSGGGLESLTSQPTVVLGDNRYFLARMEPRGDANVRALFVLYPVASWSRARWGAVLPPLGVGAGAILLSSLASGWLAQRFSRRIRLLQEQVAAIAAGDFSEIIPGPRRDEIQELVVSVNSMSAQLREMQHTIRQSERTRLLAQLAGGLAHQLRNAVTGARMALQLHQRRCDAAPEDKSLSVALRQLALTETQVRGLLSLGRGERSQPAVCEFSRIAEEVASLVEPICEHAGVSMELKRNSNAGSESSDTVRVDLESLRAAVLNLVTNAIEAAGPGGEVTLRTIREEGMLGIEVGDNGQGPPAHVADTLFEPFVSSKPEGVGLGLALARQVAVDHGGTLAWKREGSRTVFRLMLPAAAGTSGANIDLISSSVKSEIRNSKSEMANTHGDNCSSQRCPPVGLEMH